MGWLLHDVAGACIEFVKQHIHDIDTLEQLCSSISFGPEVEALRMICQERLRELRDAAALRVPTRAIPMGDSADVGDCRGSSRWPTHGGPDHWSTPMQCPKGLGW